VPCPTCAAPTRTELVRRTTLSLRHVPPLPRLPTDLQRAHRHAIQPAALPSTMKVTCGTTSLTMLTCLSGFQSRPVVLNLESVSPAAMVA